MLNTVALSEDRDAELMARTLTGDTDAFEALYKSYYRRLYRFVFRVLGRTDCIEEVVNDTMFVVWERASSFDGSSRVSTWIFGIAYNKARKHFTDARTLGEGALTGADALVDDGGLRQLEMADRLNAAFAALSAEQRAVVELTYYHGMHYREIGWIIDCPENTVKTRMFHARKKMAAVLVGDAD